MLFSFIRSLRDTLDVLQDQSKYVDHGIEEQRVIWQPLVAGLFKVGFASPARVDPRGM